MNVVKVGVIGIGNMGKSHALQLDKGLIKGAMLSAVCLWSRKANELGKKRI
ncbi:hypothetical protein R4Z09_15595 [Niallia oryzisoli]|uniref:Gfo/Idh/MocA-like oxidoreductase N-terminal domain-containing protein n=1 Tax=Niallia oryzisoli TaxID=1737571 RepID=A0ABZ2CPJ0_9BACI